MRTILQIVQAITGEMGITQPNAVVTSTDRQVIQLLNLANREGHELMKREGPVGGWPALRREQSISVVAATDNYAFPTDIYKYIDSTGWNTDTTWRLAGPQTPQEWQYIKNSGVASTIQYRYRVMDNKIYIDPVPTASATIVFEYYSKNWILDTDGTTTKEYFTADTDTPILDDELVELGVKWRFLRAKGFAYDEEKNSYEDAVEARLARAPTGRDLALGRTIGAYPHYLDRWNIPDTGVGT